jgi:hypothetical protein
MLVSNLKSNIGSERIMKLEAKSSSFKANLEIIGINPFVTVPDKILKKIFEQAGRSKGHIPIKGTINKKLYKQTLVKYSGAWRLYINTTMLTNSPKRIGERIEIAVAHDPASRAIKPPTKFVDVLNANKKAKLIFESLPPYLKLEIVRYLAKLKTEATLDRNIERAINFLLGKERFIGRDKPG